MVGRVKVLKTMRGARPGCGFYAVQTNGAAVNVNGRPGPPDPGLLAGAGQ